MVLLLLAACSNDFGLNGAKPAPAVEDTAAADTAAPVDTAGDTAPEDTDEAVDTEVPDDTEEPDTDVPADTGEESTPDDPAPADDCTETDDLIYVLDRDQGRLYTFDPAARSFTTLGRVSCGTSQTPASMAVSRGGVAYVRYADNAVYALDLATMSCTATGYSDRRTGFDSFGMGYATDSADTWRETLYVANETTVGVLDAATWDVTPLGRLPSQSELTGNAEGELWAMLPLETPAKLARIDTATGDVAEQVSLRGFPDPSNIDTFAFATWSGNFYLFVREHGMGSTTDVYEVTSAGVTTKVLADVGFDVVGAGVSTCAPS
jgi:hypothetical protein